jgi:hypothetical protein
MRTIPPAPRGVDRQMPRAPPRHLPEIQNVKKTAIQSSDKNLQETHHPVPSGIARPGLAAFTEKYGTT